MRDRKGFTYIEVLMVVLIAGMLATLSTGLYGRFFLQNEVGITADLMAAQLRKAQMYSMIGRNGAAWGVRYGGNAITLYQVGSSCCDEASTVNSNVTVSGFTSVEFIKGSGISTNGVPSSTPTISISANSTTKTVVINSQGAVMQ